MWFLCVDGGSQRLQEEQWMVGGVIWAGDGLQGPCFFFSLSWMWLVSGKCGFKKKLRGKATCSLNNINACLDFWIGILAMFKGTNLSISLY